MADLMSDEQLLWLLLLLPLAWALLCQFVHKAVYNITIAASVLQLVLALLTTQRVLDQGSLHGAQNWFYVDALSAFHLLVLALVYLASSLFARTYFSNEHGRHRFTKRVAQRFGTLWLGALVTMTLLLISNNLGVMWVGMESTTLLTAFLISLYVDRLSLEAMWKYLIICSVGIAFAFMGTLLFAAAVEHTDLMQSNGMLWTALSDPAVVFDPVLVKIAFAFLMVGFGVKAGLAPVHSWLPDAHSQAPTPVSAMFSGFMLNAALYCILRYVPLVTHVLGTSLASNMLLVFGTLSILVSAAFIVFQTDVKRLLAYHSVEHLGIIAIGYGLGPLGAFAAVFHTLNHALCKSLAFFAAGRLGQHYATHDMGRIKGAMRVDRLWSMALLGSMLALIGVAPFAIFMSEYQIVRAAIDTRQWVVLVLFLLGGSIIFISALHHIIEMLYGKAAIAPVETRDNVATRGMVVVILGLLLLLGLWLPSPLLQLMTQAARVVSG